MVEVELGWLEGEVFDAENAGYDDSCDVSTNEAINRVSKENGSNLDDDAGKFGEAKSYIFDADMSQAVDAHSYGVAEGSRR